MNKTEKIAEEVIRATYKKGGLSYMSDFPKETLNATKDDAVEYILEIYGHISRNNNNACYGLNEKGFELGRRGFFSGEEKERRNKRIGIYAAIITSVLSVIIAAIALFYSTK